MPKVVTDTLIILEVLVCLQVRSLSKTKFAIRARHTSLSNTREQKGVAWRTKAGLAHRLEQFGGNGKETLRRVSDAGTRGD